MLNISLEKIIIAAVAKNGVIGNEGKIPWSCKAELQHFKNATCGFPIVMGRKTWEAIGSPLKNRINIVLSKSLAQKEAGNDFHVFTSLKDAFKFCESQNYTKCFIIGGAQVYSSVFDFADKLIISEMKFEVVGDAYFPKYEKEDWSELSVEDFAEFTIHTYIRKEKLKEC